MNYLIFLVFLLDHLKSKSLEIQINFAIYANDRLV